MYVNIFDTMIFNFNFSKLLPKPKSINESSYFCSSSVLSKVVVHSVISS